MPSSERVVEDINTVFEVIDLVVTSEGVCIVIDVNVLRHARRLEDHIESEKEKREVRRSKKISEHVSLSELEGIHPVVKQTTYAYNNCTIFVT